MGAGCWYHHNCNKERAAWIDIWPNGRDSDDSDEAQQDFNQLLYELQHILCDKLGYSFKNPNEYYNGLFEIHLESTYYGDGLVIRIEPKIDWDGRYNLAMANHSRTEKRILRELCKQGYKLRIATSGYTATDLVVD